MGITILIMKKSHNMAMTAIKISRSIKSQVFIVGSILKTSSKNKAKRHIKKVENNTIIHLVFNLLKCLTDIYGFL
jgi:hypothetical protein